MPRPTVTTRIVRRDCPRCYVELMGWWGMPKSHDEHAMTDAPRCDLDVRDSHATIVDEARMTPNPARRGTVRGLPRLVGDRWAAMADTHRALGGDAAPLQMVRAVAARAVPKLGLVVDRRPFREFTLSAAEKPWLRAAS